jgi:hypothetical protein
MGRLEQTPSHRYTEYPSALGNSNVTLPQWSTVRNAILALIVPALLLVGPVAAQAASRQSLFTCGTDAVDDRGFLNLSGIPGGNGDWIDLRFDRTDDGDGHLTYSFPRGGTDTRTAFLFSHSDGPEGYLVSIRWVDQGLNYVYYSLALPPGPDDENDAGGGDAGLVISKRGRQIERVPCVERPHMFISYLRDATSCDKANPFGEAACRDDPYNRTEALDTGTIGLVS